MLLEIIAFSSFMTFVCTAVILFYLIFKEPEYFKAVRWTVWNLQAIKANTDKDPLKPSIKDLLEADERIEKEISKTRKTIGKWGKHDPHDGLKLKG